MIESTFLHLPSIGETTEMSLWQKGCVNWQTLMDSPGAFLPTAKVDKVLRALDLSRSALSVGDLRYFQRTLGSANVWRMLPYVQESIAYLDIESTGTGFPPYAHSTSIAISYKGQLYVEHEMGAKRRLLSDLHAEAKMWCTFSGLSFDIPFLRREFGLPFDGLHLDLRVWLGRQGHRGGLKKIQVEFSDIPTRSSMDIDGYDAVRLWRLHLQGVEGALETLMCYNAEDTVVLEALTEKAWQKEILALSEIFELSPRAPYSPPPTELKVHEEVYRRLRSDSIIHASPN